MYTKWNIVLGLLDVQYFVYNKITPGSPEPEKAK